ncbi:YitT family protein [Agromyces sp. MMS24-JH15]|uniref:membrane protein YczE n=1 Tax=Agromyces sp. MMS24-JH15 TaxID=3243765 RepID=UPI0037487543
MPNRRLASFDDPAPILTRRLVQLLVGLFLYGTGIAMIVRADLGSAPWDVLTQGIVRQTGLGFGLVVVVTSGIVLLLWIPLRQRPGFGTLMNALLVGPAADLAFLAIPEGLPLWLRIVLLPAGILVVGLASGLYIGADFGPGPRDGLMTGIHRRTGWPIWVGRTAVEVAVVLAGWLLGGVVGVGTVLFALTIGPVCGWMLPRLRIRRASERVAPADAAAPGSAGAASAAETAAPVNAPAEASTGTTATAYSSASA